jgi:hypothetical protein
MTRSAPQTCAEPTSGLLIPVLSLLVRGTGVCHIDDVTTAVPFVETGATREP